VGQRREILTHQDTRRLCWDHRALSFAAVKGKILLPVALMVVFALSRIPGMLPENFSAAYALAFCAGVYLMGSMRWWLPLVMLLLTDVGLNLYYWLALDVPAFQLPMLRYQVFVYAGYAGLIWLGRRFKPSSSFVSLLGGGILGALMFYLITNTAAWFFNPFGNPEYTKDLFGWLRALTVGTSGWPETWQFFRNTLLGGGLFTALFVGVMKLTSVAESKKEQEADGEETEGKEEEADTPERANA